MEGGHGHGADEANAPERLRTLPSRLLNLAAGYAQRMVSDRLATADARKWHYATLAALAEFGPDSQSGLSDRTGNYRSELVGTINGPTPPGVGCPAPRPGRPPPHRHHPHRRGPPPPDPPRRADRGPGGRVPGAVA